MTSPPLKYLVIPSERTAEIRALIELSTDQLKRIEAKLRSQEILQDQPPIERLLATASGLTNAGAVGVLNALYNLNRQKARYDLTDAQVADDLAVLAGGPLDTAKKEILLRLISSDSDEEYFIEKVESLRSALVPHMIDARTVVDLRPVYNRSGSEIEATLLIAYLEITTHDQEHEDNVRHVIQLSEANVRVLVELLGRTQTKLEAVKARFAGQTAMLT